MKERPTLNRALLSIRCAVCRFCFSQLPRIHLTQILHELRLQAAGVSFDVFRESCLVKFGADFCQIGFAQAMKKKLITKSKDGSLSSVLEYDDPVQLLLRAVRDNADLDEKQLKDVRERKMVKQE